jgi:hypothetical protein
MFKLNQDAANQARGIHPKNAKKIYLQEGVNESGLHNLSKKSIPMIIHPRKQEHNKTQDIQNKGFYQRL